MTAWPGGIDLETWGSFLRYSTGWLKEETNKKEEERQKKGHLLLSEDCVPHTPPGDRFKKPTLIGEVLGSTYIAAGKSCPEMGQLELLKQKDNHK